MVGPLRNLCWRNVVLWAQSAERELETGSIYIQLCIIKPVCQMIEQAVNPFQIISQVTGEVTAPHQMAYDASSWAHSC